MVKIIYEVGDEIQLTNHPGDWIIEFIIGSLIVTSQNGIILEVPKGEAIPSRSVLNKQPLRIKPKIRVLAIEDGAICIIPKISNSFGFYIEIKDENINFGNANRHVIKNIDAIEKELAQIINELSPTDIKVILSAADVERNIHPRYKSPYKP